MPSRAKQETTTLIAALLLGALAVGLSLWLQPVAIPITANAAARASSVSSANPTPEVPLASSASTVPQATTESTAPSTSSAAAEPTPAPAAPTESAESSSSPPQTTTPPTSSSSVSSSAEATSTKGAPASTTTAPPAATTPAPEPGQQSAETPKANPSTSVDTMAVFRIFAKHSFDWETSSTPTPITAVTGVAKKMLGYSPADLPEDLRALLSDTEGVQGSYRHTVPITAARKYLAPKMLEDLKALCESGTPCDFNTQDPEFGTTPLHWAAWYGEQSIVDYLLQHGANPGIVDAVGRKPANMTFANFITNSRRWAREAGRACEVPEVVLPVLSQEDGALDEAAVRHAESEVRRLISEGEPVLIRNVVPWLRARLNLVPTVASASDFVETWGHLPAKVAGIPYADNFNVSSTPMSIRDYFNTHMASKAEEKGTATDNEETEKKNAADDDEPLYVFKGDPDASSEGERLMSAFINSVFPVTGRQDSVPLICRTDLPGLGVNNVQFYLGNKGSGAPFHIHSDAANLLVNGEKLWWILPPKNATFSRMHIRTWQSTTLAAIPESERPLTCTQRSGDMMYVPFDWGHAAINLVDNTFGYTTELVNRRDALMFADNRPCGMSAAAGSENLGNEVNSDSDSQEKKRVNKKAKKAYILSKQKV